MYQTVFLLSGSLLFLLKRTLKLRQLTVRQLSCFLIIAFALGYLDLIIYSLYLLTDLRNLIYRSLFVFPLRLGLFKLFLLSGQLLLQIFETLPAQVIILFLEGRHLYLHLHYAARSFIQLCRHGIQLCLYQGACLIHQIYGFIRQETVSNIAVGKHGRAHQRIIQYLYPVIYFVALLKATQYGNGILYRRLINHNRLETPLQGRILLYILSVFIQGGGAYTVQLASCQHGFEHIACIKSSVGLACAYYGMQLIYKEDYLTVTLLYLFKHGFKTLLKLAPVLGSRNQSTHVQAKDLLIFKSARNIAAHYTLRQTFYYGSFTYTGLADEHGVVLGLSGKYADHVSYLRIPAYHGIQFLLSCLFHQILTIFFQCIISSFGIITGHPLVASYGLQCHQETLPCKSVFGKQSFYLFIGMGYHRQHQVLYGNIVITHGLCLILCADQHFIKIRTDPQISALYLHSLFKSLNSPVLKVLGIDLHLLHQFKDKRFVQPKQRVKQMLLFYLLIAVLHGQLFAVIDCLYRILCKFLNVHILHLPLHLQLI